MKGEHAKALKHVVTKHKIKKRHERILSKHPKMIKMLKKVPEKQDPKSTQQWIIQEFIEILDTIKEGCEELSIDPYDFVELVNIVESGSLTKKNAKKLLKRFIPKSFSAKKHLNLE